MKDNGELPMYPVLFLLRMRTDFRRQPVGYFVADGLRSLPLQFEAHVWIYNGRQVIPVRRVRPDERDG